VRTCFSLIAILAAIAYAEPALADTPPDVYSDFAEDGVLNCGHTKSAMKGILNDASIYQYGDPLTFLQLKLAIRRQLAGGCDRRPAASASNGTSPVTPGATEPGEPAAKNPTKGSARSERGAQDEPRTPAQSAGVQRGGVTVILGVGLLLLALGSGGWAAKRAFSD
jgi:hypothetical protein